MQAEDRYLLCSDGLHEVVGDDAIAGVLRAVADPDEAARDLIALAIAGGGPDNVTCIVADVVPSQLPAAVACEPATTSRSAVEPAIHEQA